MANLITKSYRFASWELTKLFNKFSTRLGKRFERPLTLYSSRWLKYVMNNQMGKSEPIFMQEGILPILDHYYQPLINPKKHLTKSLRDDRELPGLDFNIDEQLELLTKFKYNEELLKFPIKKNEDQPFYYDNGWYPSGDAEYLYNMVRHFKPKRIFEVGSGFSTLVVKAALDKNKATAPASFCEHICIEPYEQPWLEKTISKVIREKVETIDKSFFRQLAANDILFIDSSHIIRPQGDVLFEYLEVLPVLAPGVIVHVHDIFTPKDYPDEWVYNRHSLWNEQYLLEAFLTFNSEFRIIGSLNYLAHHYKKELAEKCPVFAQQDGQEPGAFWIIKK